MLSHDPCYNMSKAYVITWPACYNICHNMTRTDHVITYVILIVPGRHLCWGIGSILMSLIVHVISYPICVQGFAAFADGQAGVRGGQSLFHIGFQLNELTELTEKARILTDRTELN